MWFAKRLQSPLYVNLEILSQSKRYQRSRHSAISRKVLIQISLKRRKQQLAGQGMNRPVPVMPNSTREDMGMSARQFNFLLLWRD